MENRSPPQGDEAPPEIPGYRLLHLISRGGMGAVYLAEQEMLRRQIALKVTLPFLGEIDPGFPDRFAREAKATANLDHPNIVRVHDAGEASGRSYLAMEYIGDGTLKELLAEREGGLAHRWICEVIAGICEGLHAAHTAGYIHRDIKPDNVLMRGGEIPIVTDFGIAKAVDANPKLTQTVGTMGSPYYMSPEQLRGEQVDHRSDLYGVGVMLFEMLERRTPFEGDTAFAVYYQHLTETPPALSPQNEAFSDIVHALLAKQADQRQSTARLVTEQLRGLAARTGDGMGLPFSGTRPALQRTDAGRAEAAARSAALPAQNQDRQRGSAATSQVPGHAPAAKTSGLSQEQQGSGEEPDQAATNFMPIQAASAVTEPSSGYAPADEDAASGNRDDEVAESPEPDLPTAAETSFMPLPPTPNVQKVAAETEKEPPTDEVVARPETRDEPVGAAETSFMPLPSEPGSNDPATRESDQPDPGNQTSPQTPDGSPAAAATSFMPLPASKPTDTPQPPAPDSKELKAVEPVAETSFMPLAVSNPSTPEPGSASSVDDDPEEPLAYETKAAAEPDAAETSFMPLPQSAPPSPVSGTDGEDQADHNADRTDTNENGPPRQDPPLATAVMPMPQAPDPKPPATEVANEVASGSAAKPPPAATAVMSLQDLAESTAAPGPVQPQPETGADDGWIDEMPKKRGIGKWLALLALLVVAGAWGLMFLRDGPASPPDTGGLQVISTPPGARIYIANRYYGTTPLLVEGLDAGSAVVRLDVDGYSSYTTVATVEIGRNNKLEANLKPLP